MEAQAQPRDGTYYSRNLALTTYFKAVPHRMTNSNPSVPDANCRDCGERDAHADYGMFRQWQDPATGTTYLFCSNGGLSILKVAADFSSMEELIHVDGVNFAALPSTDSLAQNHQVEDVDVFNDGAGNTFAYMAINNSIQASGVWIVALVVDVNKLLDLATSTSNPIHRVFIDLNSTPYCVG
jgi:hypothetical protein